MGYTTYYVECTESIYEWINGNQSGFNQQLDQIESRNTSNELHVSGQSELKFEKLREKNEKKITNEINSIHIYRVFKR